MSPHAESVTVGEISCPSCEDIAALERGQVVMPATIATFWNAHRDCGRIQIDLQVAECATDKPRLH